VVMPEECQSIPMTAPKDWNQNGCASRRNSSARPYSCTMASLMTRPSIAIRPESHAGTCPECKGKLAVPERCGMARSYPASTSIAATSIAGALAPTRILRFSTSYSSRANVVR
jgi:hypothetical protein